jgi:hypothetical protein
MIIQRVQKSRVWTEVTDKASQTSMLQAAIRSLERDILAQWTHSHSLAPGRGSLGAFQGWPASGCLGIFRIPEFPGS